MSEPRPETPSLVSIQVGLPQTCGEAGATDPMRVQWTSAFVKQPVHGRVFLSNTGLAGDGQADREVHGGPERALLAYSAGHYPLWRAELGMADPIEDLEWLAYCEWIDQARRLRFASMAAKRKSARG